MNLKDYPPIKHVTDILKNIKKGEDIPDMEIYTKEEIDEQQSNENDELGDIRDLVHDLDEDIHDRLENKQDKILTPSALFTYQYDDSANSSIVPVEMYSEGLNFHIPLAKVVEAFPDFPISEPTNIQNEWINKFLFTFIVILGRDDSGDGYSVQFTGFTRNVSDVSLGYPMATVADYGKITTYSYSPDMYIWNNRLNFGCDLGNGNFNLPGVEESASSIKKITVAMVRIKQDGVFSGGENANTGLLPIFQKDGNWLSQYINPDCKNPDNGDTANGKYLYVTNGNKANSILRIDPNSGLYILHLEFSIEDAPQDYIDISYLNLPGTKLNIKTPVITKLGYNGEDSSRFRVMADALFQNNNVHMYIDNTVFGETLWFVHFVGYTDVKDFSGL